MAFKRPTLLRTTPTASITIYDESLYFIYGNLFGRNEFQSGENLNATAQ